MSYFLWFWHKHKRDEQKHERPPKAWAQNRNSAVSVHTLWPKVDPMAKSSRWGGNSLSFSGGEECGFLSGKKHGFQARVQHDLKQTTSIHSDSLQSSLRKFCWCELQNRAFLIPAYEINWPGKDYIHQKKKKSFESCFAKETDNGQWTCWSQLSLCLAHSLHPAYLDIAGIQSFFPLLLQSRANSIILEVAATPMSWNESSPEATLLKNSSVGQDNIKKEHM